MIKINVIDPSCVPVPMPTPKHWIQPVLIVLSVLSQNRAHTYYPHQEVIKRALELEGYDPDNLPAGWVGQRRTEGIERRIQLAYREMRGKYVNRYKGTREVLTESGGRGLWGLTEAGVREARLMRGANLTSQWIEAQGPPLIEKMKQAVRRRLKTTAEAGKVEDVVNDQILKMIRLDSLAKKIEAGKPIYQSQIAAYAVNMGITEARSAAVDAAARTTYGALTEQERQRRKAKAKRDEDRGFEAQTVQSTATHKDSIWVAYNANPEEGVLPFDAEDIDSEKNVESSAAFDSLWEALGNILSPRQREIMLLKSQGYTVAEIAEEKGLSFSRVNKLIAETRSICRDSPALQDFMVA